jgi:hypothetical protein
MLLTRQQVKAQKRNAKRLGELLKDVRKELEQSLAVVECSAVGHGSWERADISYSQDAHSVIGEILAIADKWNQLNHFEIEEKLSEIEKKFYQN